VQRTRMNASEEEVRREVKKAITQGLLGYNLIQLYSLLGTYTSMAQAEYRLIRSRKLRARYRGKYRIRGLMSVLTYETPEEAGRKFLERYQKKILRSVCKHWREIKEERLDNLGLITWLASDILQVIPDRYRSLTKIAVVIAFILFKMGLDKLCEG